MGRGDLKDLRDIKHNNNNNHNNTTTATTTTTTTNHNRNTTTNIYAHVYVCIYIYIYIYTFAQTGLAKNRAQSEPAQHNELFNIIIIIINFINLPL